MIQLVAASTPDEQRPPSGRRVGFYASPGGLPLEDFQQPEGEPRAPEAGTGQVFVKAVTEEAEPWYWAVWQGDSNEVEEFRGPLDELRAWLQPRRPTAVWRFSEAADRYVPFSE